MKAPPPPPILCVAQSPDRLDSPALHFGLSEVCLTFMNCKASLDLFQYTALYQQSRRVKEEYPTALPSKGKRMKAPPPPPILCVAQSPDRLDSPALHFGLSEVCLTFMNCKASLDLFQYTALYQQSRRVKEERRMKLSSPPRLPSQPQCINPYLPCYQQPTGINSLKACGDESIIAINNIQMQHL
ncbi:hypothetical protein llap_9652 [Limosa lapponica baueri]|uniref:Uncharacterized protein n=1 Tax=Limosa lapponica baueri TaxID=1758121 RepID=A0A2I0U1Z2_LIMLA|nr:hypothetical protein llap_9652 [Limosa lapponica baueri]